jgi:hypothetical protein
MARAPASNAMTASPDPTDVGQNPSKVAMGGGEVSPDTIL